MRGHNIYFKRVIPNLIPKVSLIPLLIWLSSFSPLWETARYRQKYCLKGPLNQNQPTNQPTLLICNVDRVCHFRFFLVFIASRGSFFKICFISTAAGSAPCGGRKSLPIHHHSAGYIFSAPLDSFRVSLKTVFLSNLLLTVPHRLNT